MGNNRILYLEFLRVISAIAVVAIHVAAFLWFDTPQTISWEILVASNGFIRWCVPVFVMISGAIYLDPRKDVTYKKILSAAIPRILVALVFWGIIYGAWYNRDLFMAGNFSQFFLRIPFKIIFGPTAVHLWFLYLIIGLYLLTPLLRKITQTATKNDYQYLLLLFVMFGSLLPLISNLSGHHISFTIPELTSFVSYYILGYYVSQLGHTFNTKLLWAMLFIGCLLIPGLEYIYRTVTHIQNADLFFDYLFVGTIMSSISIFALSLKYVTQTSVSNRLTKIITVLADYSFGVYLIHKLFIEIFRSFAVNLNAINQVLLVVALTFGFFLISVGATAIIKKVPVLGKWIV